MVTNGDSNGKTIQIKLAERDIDDLKRNVRDLHQKFDDHNKDLDQWLDEKFSEVFTSLGQLRVDKAKMVGIALGVGAVGSFVGVVATIMTILQYWKN